MEYSASKWAGAVETGLGARHMTTEMTFGTVQNDRVLV